MHRSFVSRYLSRTVVRSIAAKARLLDAAEQHHFVRDWIGIDVFHEGFGCFGDAPDAAANDDFSIARFEGEMHVRAKLKCALRIRKRALR